MEKRIKRLIRNFFSLIFLGEGFGGCLEGFIIVDILFPSMKSILKWWSQFYCLFNVGDHCLTLLCSLHFFFVHKVFNSGISIQVCRKHLFLLYAVASDRAVSTQDK